MSSYLFSEFLKISKLKPFWWLVILFVVSNVIVGWALGGSISVDSGDNRETEDSVRSFFFMAENYLFLPSLLFIPYFFFEIEHNNNTLFPSYFVYTRPFNWIISKVFWIILAYEMILFFALYAGIATFSFFLQQNTGQAPIHSINEMMLSYGLLYAIFYLPNLLLITWIVLRVRSLSIVIMAIVLLHIVSLQSFFKELNPFHSFLFTTNIQDRLDTNCSCTKLYTEQDIWALLPFSAIASLILIALIIFTYHNLKNKTI